MLSPQNLAVKGLRSARARSLNPPADASGPPRLQTGRSGLAPKTAGQVMLRAVTLIPARAGS
jgi:hypothetical protein